MIPVDRDYALQEIRRMLDEIGARVPKPTARAVVLWSEQVLTSHGRANHRRIRIPRDVPDLPAACDALGRLCEWLWTALDPPAEPDPVEKYWTLAEAFSPKADALQLRELQRREGYGDVEQAYRIGVDAAARMYMTNVRTLHAVAASGGLT